MRTLQTDCGYCLLSSFLFLPVSLHFCFGYRAYLIPPEITLPSSIRIVRSAIWAISSLCVIIIVVWRNCLLMDCISRMTSILVLESRLPVGTVQLVQHREPPESLLPSGVLLFSPAFAILPALFYFFTFITNHCAICQSSVFPKHIPKTFCVCCFFCVRSSVYCYHVPPSLLCHYRFRCGLRRFPCIPFQAVAVP